MALTVPRLVIAGLSGDSGKTIASLCLTSVLRRQGLAVAVFKKGPDYIDAAWLTSIAHSSCRNLDTYLVPEDRVKQSFFTHAAEADIAIVEGNRGLFDGKDVDGTHSTAALARLLDAPVVLVVNATKTTRTIAALVKGCCDFEPDVRVAGVILNQVGGPRHRAILEDSIKKHCGIPVLGAFPRLKEELIPERHLGLITPAEFSRDKLEQRLSELGRAHLDLDHLSVVARSASSVDLPQQKVAARKPSTSRIAYFSDSVFTFYYPENLEALEAAGATLVPISSLKDADLPEVDGLYIGGGFPETHARQLADNPKLMADVKTRVHAGLPVYAECGGLIYLCRSLKVDDETFPMAGVFDFDLSMHAKPQGHGYTEYEVTADTPFYPAGQRLRGHEFHYSAPTDDSTCQGVMTITTGTGLGNGTDGLLYRNCLATYAHHHAGGLTQWADRFVAAARAYKGEQEKSQVRKPNRGTQANGLQPTCG